MTERPEIPVVPLRDAAQLLGLTPRAAESALRHAGIRSGYPLAAVEWLRDNRPGRGNWRKAVKRWEIRFINWYGRVVRTEEYDDLEAAKEREQQTRYAEPAGSGWTITTWRDGGESEMSGLHD